MFDIINLFSMRLVLLYFFPNKLTYGIFMHKYTQLC